MLEPSPSWTPKPSISRRRGVHEIYRRKELSVEATIPGKQPGRLRLRMGPDQEVRQNSCSLTALSTIAVPYATCREVSRPRQRLDSDFVVHKKGVTISLRGKMDTQFGIYQVANHQRSGRCCIFQSCNRSIAELLIRHENIQQHVCVNG